MESTVQNGTNVCSIFKLLFPFLFLFVIATWNFSAHYHQRTDYQTFPDPISRIKPSLTKPRTLKTPLEFGRTNIANKNASEEDQFMTFLDIRRASLSVLNVFAFEHPIQYKLNYLNISLMFIREKFAEFGSIGFDERKVSHRLLKSLEEDVICWKMSRNGLGENACRFRSHLTEQYFVSKVGSWYNYLKKSYLQFSHEYHKHCRAKIENERKQISDRIADVQFGSTCRNSKTVLDAHLGLHRGKIHYKGTLLVKFNPTVSPVRTKVSLR